MTEVVIDTSVAGMDLSTEGKEWLYENARDKFFSKTLTEPVVGEYKSPKTLDSDRFKWNWKNEKLWDEATRSWWYFSANGTVASGFGGKKEARTDDDLLYAVKEFGGGDGLRVVEIPDGVDWYVTEGEDGSEYVAEEHRTWP